MGPDGGALPLAKSPLSCGDVRQKSPLLAGEGSIDLNEIMALAETHLCRRGAAEIVPSGKNMTLVVVPLIKNKANATKVLCFSALHAIRKKKKTHKIWAGGMRVVHAAKHGL